MNILYILLRPFIYILFVSFFCTNVFALSSDWSFGDSAKVRIISPYSQNNNKELLIGLEYVFKRRGPMTMGASQLCGFAKSDPSRDTPNLQFHIQPISTDKLGGANLHDFHAFTPTVANIRPTSRGEISISSSDTKVSPKIKMNYLSTDEDRKVAADGIKLIRKIVMETNEFKK